MCGQPEECLTLSNMPAKMDLITSNFSILQRRQRVLHVPDYMQHMTLAVSSIGMPLLALTTVLEGNNDKLCLRENLFWRVV